MDGAVPKKAAADSQPLKVSLGKSDCSVWMCRRTLHLERDFQSQDAAVCVSDRYCSLTFKVRLSIPVSSGLQHTVYVVSAKPRPAA